MSNLYYILAVFFAIILLSSCKKEEDEVLYVPALTFKNISPATVIEFEDSVVITLAYKDDDGDLGNSNPDSLSLWVKDSRLSNADWYHIPPLTPNEKSLAISGTFKIKLNSVFLLGNTSQESTYFTIKIKDRSKNWSEEVQSSSITIVSQ